MTRKTKEATTKTCAACNSRFAECNKKKSPEKDYWIDCDSCHKWFHGQCCGLTKLECNRICPFTPESVSSEDHRQTAQNQVLKRNTLQNLSPANLRQTPRRSQKAIEAAETNSSPGKVQQRSVNS